MSHSYLPLTSHKGEIALSVGVELSFLDESSQREVLEQCAINDCTPSYSQAWRMHKADREGTLTTAVIQTIMSEEKANQRETVKVPISRLREVLPQGLDAKKTEDFHIKIKPKSDYPLKTLYPRAFQTGQNHLIYYDFTTVE